MNTRIFVFLAVFIVLLSFGCSNPFEKKDVIEPVVKEIEITKEDFEKAAKEEVEEEDVEEEETEDKPEEEVEELQEATGKVDLDEKEEIISKLELGSRVVFLNRLKRLKVGEGYTYGIGIANYLPYGTEEDFYIVLRFVEAKDSLNNEITVNKKLVEKGWLSKNDFGYINVPKFFTIDRNSYDVIPVTVEVGDEIKDGVKTELGTYTFSAEVFYNDDNDDRQDYGGIYYMYVKVTE